MSRNGKLTRAQKAALESLKEKKQINVNEIHGNKIRVYQSLRQRRLIIYFDGSFIYAERVTPEQCKEFILKNDGILSNKRVAENLMISITELNRYRNELGLPSIRGRKKKLASD